MIKKALLGKESTVFVIVLYGILSLVNGWHAGFIADNPNHGIISAVAAVGCLSYAIYRTFELGKDIGLER